MYSRIRFLFILVLLLAAGCRVTVRGGPTSPPAPIADGADARLTRQRDNVQHGADEATLVQVSSSVDVRDGELIRITGGGEGWLDFGEALVLRLFNDSLLQTVNTAPAPGASGAAYVFSLQQGGLSGHLAGAEETAVIATPGGATITILGTQFFVVYDQSTGETIVGNFDGSVEVDDGSGSFALGASQQVALPGRIQQPLPITLSQFEQRARASGPVAAAQSLQPEPSPAPTATSPPGRALPDLAAVDLVVVGEPRVERVPAGIAFRENIRVPVRLTVTNRGALPAPVFQTGISARVGRSDRPFCFSVERNADACFPATDRPLPPGESRSFEGLLDVPVGLAGSTLQLAGEADICVPGANLPDYCQVQESDETNNQSAVVSVELPAPPDLLVSSITTTGEISWQQEGLLGYFSVPVAVTVDNQGGLPAGIFRVSIEAITFLGQDVFPFTVQGQESLGYPITSAPLAAGDSVTFQGVVIIWDGYAGPAETVRLLALADSCAVEELMDPECRVVEGDEDNNWSAELPVRLPSIVD